MKRIVFILFVALAFISCSNRYALNNSGKKSLSKDDALYEYYLGEGLRLKYLGNEESAVIIFEKCKELDPERSVPYYELAQIYSSNGYLEKALGNIRMAALLDKNNYWYQLACGTFYLESKQVDSAVVYFERAQRLTPYSNEATDVLAELYYETGSDNKADSIYQALSDLGSIDERQFLNMVSGLIRERKYEEAAKRLISFIKNNPSDLKYKALLGQIYSEMGENEKSDSIYTDIIKMDPESAESQLYVLISLFNKKEYNNVSKFIGNIFRSDIIVRERKVALAIQIMDDSTYMSSEGGSIEKNFEILEEKYAEDEEVLSLRPMLYEKTKQVDKAINLYMEILERIKPGFYFKERLILLYAENKMFKELFDLSEVYSKENNLSLIGKVYYAIAAMELEKYEIAETELNKCMILAGNDKTLQVQILNMQAELKYLNGDSKGSFEYYEKILEIVPDDIVAMNNYAYFLAENNEDLDKAEKLIKKVLVTEGDNPTYLDTYAWILYKKKKYKSALKIMEDVLGKQSGEDSEIFEHMGFILKGLSKCNKAVFYWEKAYLLDSKKDYLKAEIQRCKKGF